MGLDLKWKFSHDYISADCGRNLAASVQLHTQHYPTRGMEAPLRKWALFLLALAGVASVRAERPVLDLFGGGASVATIEVLVATAEEFTAPLALNEDTENLVTDADEDIQYVIAKLNNNGGGSGSADLLIDASMSDFSLPLLVDVREDGEIEISIGADSFNASAANYSSVLALLSYRSNLSSSALSEPQRNVTITAYDEVGPGNTLTALIELRVPNQHVPVFTENATYSVSLPENSAAGTEIDVVSAEDPEGRVVAYSMTSSVFAIDADTGVVRVTSPAELDYEDRRDFELTIAASDQDPFSPLTAEATLTITLTNVNDNNPTFDPDSYDADVPENVEGAFVVMLTASDADGDSLEYFFADTSTESTFQLDPNTGAITVREQLDYESTTTYTFGVLVSDGARSDSATVTVHVTDVADGRPVVLPLRKTILLNLDEGNFE